MGKLYQIPSVPQYEGKMSKNGIRNNNWRVVDKKMAILALPMDWYKLVHTIWKPINGNKQVKMRRPYELSAFRSVSVENIDTIHSGKNWQANQPNVPKATTHPMV